MFRKLIVLAIDFSSGMKKKNIDTCAGSTSFFLILSLIPLLILLSSFLPYTAVTKTDLVNAVTEITPDFAWDILFQLIDEAYSKTVSIMSLSALITIWAGALGMLAIIRGLNSIYGITEQRNEFLLRLIAVLYTLAMIIIVLLMLVVMVFGNVLGHFLIVIIPHLEKTLVFLSGFKFIIVIVGATILFALIYTYVPDIKLRFINQIPGAAFTAIVWYFFSLIFSIYVNHTNNYNTLYGSLATPVVIMFWLYFCIYIFFIGAVINQFLMDISSKKLNV